MGFLSFGEVYIPHHQCFPNSVKGKQKNPLARWIGNFAGGIFYWVVRIWEEKILNIGTFFKEKTRFCKYWTSIKIQISMTCIFKDYKFKTKMSQEQWLQLNIKSLQGSNVKVVI